MRETPDLDFSPLDPDRYVSRIHAEITVRDGKVYLQDLGSRNGTKVNDILLGEKAVTITSQDRITIGRFTCRLRT